ncbi:periplasmic nitrate reductase, electron transfer subunit [Marinobacterium nitratireducens]|uniref:Periplasmic nitrate reductase, electron transfer subunit n=1 Tax=Marinobacterium nitratireducens TaxID=518897 RepID=A0A918DSF2_9GAMM|nr:nitrate reductase cytochrome c-type subunit [Marinobacterium nitratireducens]GGO80490.1 periplasmic nitrate reductase, electron transfer subunit [Marinobacterium nitratireducens]
MNRKPFIPVVSAVLATLILSLSVHAEPYPPTPGPDGVRPGGTLFESLPAPEIKDPVDSDTRRVRAYPEQPPTIPHTVRDYQVDTNSNRCLDCHTRIQTGVSGAPMISITHFMDRDFQVLATVAPRRYFCMQCHVPQSDAPLSVQNTFKDVDILLRGTDDAEGEAQ